jgi:hypothetical protein
MSDNPLAEIPQREQRIRERAYQLWQADGSPHGRDLEYWERARELVGIEESAGAALLSNPSTHPARTGLPDGVEEAEIQANYGEFPDRFADQGEWQQTPEARHSPRRRGKTTQKAATAGPRKSAGSS